MLLRNHDMTDELRPIAQRAFEFACAIVRLHSRLNAIPRFPFTISRQLLRSGTSVGANLEEGRSASSRRDLKARQAIALREARETKYWLRLIAATGLAPAELVAADLQEADELAAILYTSVQRLKDG
jgi:four helix bundle protein